MAVAKASTGTATVAATTHAHDTAFAPPKNSAHAPTTSATTSQP